MTTQIDVISGLPGLKWRGFDAPPYDVVTFSWAHRQSPRVVPYVDGDMHDNTGRSAFQFSARLYFCNTLERRQNLFPALWEQEWKDALLDGSPGDLVHPILGPVRARVTHAGGKLVASVRSGIIVDASWVETLEDPERPTELLAGDVDIEAAATAADAAIAAFSIPYPDGTNSLSLLDAIKSIKGQIFAAALSVTGAINAAIGTVTDLINTVTILNDSSAWMVSATLMTLYQSLKELGKKAKVLSARTTAFKLLDIDTTLDAFAAAVGNSLQDVMGLNTSALAAPIVKKGSSLLFYTSK